MIDLNIKENTSMAMDVKLKDFSIHDVFSTSTMYNSILMTDRVDENDYLLRVGVETKPENGLADLCVSAQLARIDIIINVPLLQQVLSFFTVQQVKSTSTQKQPQRVQQQPTEPTRLQLELMIMAPRFIVPLDVTSIDSPRLLVDLGKLVVRSEPHTNVYRLQLSGVGVDMHSPILDKVDINVDIEQAVDQLYIITGKIPLISVNIKPQQIQYIIKVLNNVLELIDGPPDKPIRYKGFLTMTRGERIRGTSITNYTNNRYRNLLV
jgi:hypothetical protein